ncbi:MAG: EexN family lipoprotein [Betaproteobacteria bacterium]|nr:EexN family lipoprotein [Betaproteobacteria bacterium]
MKVVIFSCCLFFVSTFLFACEEKQEGKSVEYYLSNEKELDKKLEECKSHSSQSTPDCDNARAADYKRNVL